MPEKVLVAKCRACDEEIQALLIWKVRGNHFIPDKKSPLVKETFKHHSTRRLGNAHGMFDLMAISAGQVLGVLTVIRDDDDRSKLGDVYMEGNENYLR